MTREIEVIRLEGFVGYREMLAVQRERRDRVERGEAANALFLLEHAPVITLGRASHREHLLKSPEEYAGMGIEVVDSDRGGDVTYHGPGQLVAYPVLNLEAWRPSVGWYLRGLEEAIIRTLRSYGLEGERVPGLTGVWVRGGKVAAIGVGVHRWVTNHGAALNVSPNLAHFGVIVPCGIPDRPVTSLALLLEETPPLSAVGTRFAECFLEVFQ